MKKLFSLSLCILMAAVLLFTSCGAALAEAPAAPAKAVRTVMLYLCGSNLETNYGMVTWNLVQLMNAEVSPDLNVVVLTGGSDEWQTEAEYLEGAEAIGVDQHVQAWIVSGKNAENAENGHGKMTLLADWPAEYASALMSDGQTLQAFINYAAANYPAEIYDLVLWDHGGGPHGGFAVDDYDITGSTMSVSSIARAVKNSAVDKFCIIDFDACLMSSAEIAAILSEYTDYLIVSSETEPGYGQEYTTWFNALSANPRINGFDLGKIIVDAYVAFYSDENSEGYGQTGILAVIDIKNFRERLVPQLTRLAETMIQELTVIGKVNSKINYYDELKAGVYSYEYTDPALTDLSTLANSLSLTRTEIENIGRGSGFSMLKNAYTSCAGEIEAILADQDGSGDDVIYCNQTEDMDKTTSAKDVYVRGADGVPVHATSILPTGMSIFFAPTDVSSVMTYLQVMNDLDDVVSDEVTKTFLRLLKDAAIRCLLVYETGCAVSALSVAGDQSIYYKDVRDYWTEQRELDSYEISLYKEQVGVTANITGMTSALWDEYIGMLVETLDQTAVFDTETWLALITGQQSTEAIAVDRTTASAVDMNGDGVANAYRISIPASLTMVKDVSIGISADCPALYGFDEDLHKYLFDNKLTLGRIHGSPAMEEFLYTLYDYEDLEYAIREVYRSESVDYELPTSVDSWYEIVDSEGVGHLVCVGEVSPVASNERQIPVCLTLTEKDEDGNFKTINGFLHYSNGRFTGFSEGSLSSPLIALNNKIFEGATVQTAQYATFEILGFTLYFLEPVSEGFVIPADEENWGMKLTMTKLGDIRDLQGMNLNYTSMITNLYGYDYDISGVVSAANEAAANGSLIRSIEMADLDVESFAYDENEHKASVTVIYNGTELTAGEDYAVLSEAYTEPGTYKAVLFGMGNYMGYRMMTFDILPAEEAEAPAAETETAGT